jgi:hypothetical protein
MAIKGILWHSTGANNPNLKRYVQPSDNASDRDTMLKLLGINTNKNDWNHIERQAGLNAWIGKLADGTITTVQTMPWNYRPWGCGSGPKGSCNNGWIQFEICEDNLTDKNYFDKVYKEACELTAYLCEMYDIDPKGSVTMNGVKVPTILCHADSYKLGMGGNHSDVLHWFPKFNKNMDTVRNDVAELMGKNKTSTIIPSNKEDDKKEELPKDENLFKVGDEVKLIAGAKYVGGKTIPSWVFRSKLYVRSLRADGIVISTQKTGAVTGVVAANDLTLYSIGSASSNKNFVPYLVRITADVLNVRAGAGTNYRITTQVKKGNVFTIVDSKGDWGKLKSGAGWIHLDYTKKL